jgi:hypothetical protein
MLPKIENFIILTLSVCLQSTLSNEVHITQPQGFIILGKEYFFCHLKKVIYDFHQSPHAWCDKINPYLCA